MVTRICRPCAEGLKSVGIKLKPTFAKSQKDTCTHCSRRRFCDAYDVSIPDSVKLISLRRGS